MEGHKVEPIKSWKFTCVNYLLIFFYSKNSSIFLEEISLETFTLNHEGGLEAVSTTGKSIKRPGVGEIVRREKSRGGIFPDEIHPEGLREEWWIDTVMDSLTSSIRDSTICQAMGLQNDPHKLFRLATAKNQSCDIREDFWLLNEVNAVGYILNEGTITYIIIIISSSTCELRAMAMRSSRMQTIPVVLVFSLLSCKFAYILSEEASWWISRETLRRCHSIAESSSSQPEDSGVSQDSTTDVKFDDDWSIAMSNKDRLFSKSLTTGFGGILFFDSDLVVNFPEEVSCSRRPLMTTKRS